VASSSIDNINTTVERFLQLQIFPEREQRQPDKGILRYRDALLWGYEQLKNVPLPTRLSWASINIWCRMPHPGTAARRTASRTAPPARPCTPPRPPARSIAFQEQLLSLPTLCLSGYINRNRADYCRVLHDVREKQPGRSSFSSS
jgi:hypothetical protein